MQKPLDLKADPWAAWLHDHQPTAMVQGWGLWESGSEIRLQKVDEPEPGMIELKGDLDAWDHVLANAPTDKTCRAALEFLAAENPRELLGWTAHRPGLDESIQVLIIATHLRSGERL